MIVRACVARLVLAILVIGLNIGASTRAAAQATATFPGTQSGGGAPPPATVKPESVYLEPESASAADDLSKPRPARVVAPAPPPRAAPAPPPYVAPPPVAEPEESLVPVPTPAPPVSAPASIGSPQLAASPKHLVWPSRLPFVKGDRILPGYHVESRAATGTLAAGALILGSGYLIALLSDLEGEGAGWRFIPAVGPFGAMASRKLECEKLTRVDLFAAGEQQNRCAQKAIAEGKTIGWLLASGLVQMAGASTLIVGLLTGTTEQVRDDISLSPALASGRYELQVVGSF